MVSALFSRFYAPLIGYFMLCSVATLWVGKASLHLYLNQFHHPLADLFFRYYTHVGDGLAGMVLLPYLLYYRKYRELAISTLLLAGSGLVIQLFKRYIFADYHRPSLVFSEPTLHLVEGVEMAKHFSFPSGHSCTSVVLFFILAMLIRKPTAYLPLALLAIVACISRAYLSQHFLIDTVGGGLWGLVCCTFAYKYFTRV